MKNFKNNNNNQVPNLLANGTTIVGDIVSDGDFRVEGNIKGTIKVKGRIVVGESGNIEGEVICSDADICGIVKGTLTVANLSTFKSTAKFIGDLITKKISIEPNATFTGTCKMELGSEQKK